MATTSHIQDLSDAIEWNLILSSPSAIKSDSPSGLISQGSFIQLLSMQSDLFEDLDHILQNYIDSNPLSSTPILDALCLGIACLNAFIQDCWTGPQIEFQPNDLFQSPPSHSELLSLLSRDGEEVYPLTPSLLLLAMALRILHHESLNSLKSIHWWRYRSLMIQQKIIENPCASLMDEIQSLLSLIQLPELDESTRTLHALYYLEKGLVHHYYELDKKSKEEFVKSQTIHLLNWSLTGALGKRTKFQTFDVSQLIVKASSGFSGTSMDVNENSLHENIPKSLDLNDDVLLESVEYSHEPQSSHEEPPTKEKQSNLHPLDQCILLAFCLNIKNTNPMDGLTIEEMNPFVVKVLENPNNWLIHSMALLLRSRLECHKSRTVERSALQLQALVDQFALKDPNPTERLKYFFGLNFPCKWEMERELGTRFVSLGVVRSALEIFTRLEMWEDVISCHQMLQEPKKAQLVIERLLKSHPQSPKFNCIYGDVLGNVHYYQLAWEYSGNRYSRAMRSLGAHYFKTADYKKCIECYQNALAINPLYENSWFVLGCAAMRIENWSIAIEAFQRVVFMDSENGEAWNNLASVFIKEKKKREAWRALKEALRSKFDSSNIWENYLYVSIDLKEFAESIRSMERILETRLDKVKDKEKCVDMQVLRILVDAFTLDLLDANQEPISKHISKFKALLELIHSKMSHPTIQIESARFYEFNQEYKKSLEFRQKAFRNLLNSCSLLNSESNAFPQLCQITLELVDSYYRLGPLNELDRMGDALQPVCKDYEYQSKMCLKTLIKRTMDLYKGTREYDELVTKLESLASIDR